MTIYELSTGDTAWVMIAAALVVLMTPALAFFYGGMVRAFGVLNMIMMSVVTMGTVGIAWVLFGYSMAFGNSWNGLIGNPLEFAGMQGTIGELLGDPSGAQIPVLAFAGFQAAFAIIATALISGAVADRMKFNAWLVFSVVWASIVYFPVAHWVFSFDGYVSEKGGWIANKVEAIDFAGGTAIHINAGAAALVLAIVLGPRMGWKAKPMRPHNLTLVMLGAGLLWFGWFGFNAGSALAADETAALAWFNTLIGAGAGMLGWLITERIRDGHATSLGGASGIVAGLVGITPACASVSPLGAIVIGVLAGAICSSSLSLKYRFGFDDSLDVVGVHLIGGLVGTIAVGFLAIDGVGLFYGGGWEQIGRQIIGAVAVLAYSLVVTFIIAKALDKIMGLRIDSASESAGADLTEHAEVGYDLSNVRYSALRVNRTVVVPAKEEEVAS